MNYQSAKSDRLDAAAPPPPARRRRRALARLRVVVVLAMIAGLGVWAFDWISAALIYVRETDARIDADMITVSSRIAGRIDALPVTEGDRVAKGAVLARLDQRDAELRLSEYLAERDGNDAERARLDSQIIMVGDRTQSRLRGERARLDAARALVQAAESEFSFAAGDFERTKSLAASGVVSRKALDAARAAYLGAQQALLRAKAQAAGAQARLAEADGARREVDVLRGERDMLAANRTEVQAKIDRQLALLDDHVIVSPIDGVISRTFAEAGEYLRPGQRIALMHDPNAIWVEANIRETEIGRLAVGQSVRVSVDAYPDIPFTGRVARIGQAATSAFALLPSPNPSGNFTKVTQRLPVRIALAQRDGLLRPGMMVEVSIDVGAR